MVVVRDFPRTTIKYIVLRCYNFEQFATLIYLLLGRYTARSE